MRALCKLSGIIEELQVDNLQGHVSPSLGKGLSRLSSNKVQLFNFWILFSFEKIKNNENMESEPI